MSLFHDRRQHLGPPDVQPFMISQVKHKESDQMDVEPARDEKTGLRPVFIKQGVDREASGSAFYEVGGTRLQVSVHGPLPARGEFKKQAELVVQAKVESFAGIQRKPQMEILVQDFVKSSLKAALILKEYPKSSIFIQISILTGNDSVSTNLAAAVNASVLALVNAGIAMHDMVVASAVALGHERQCLVDEEANDQVMQLAASFYTASKCELVSLKLTGSDTVERNQLAMMMSKAQDAAVTLRLLLNGYIVEDYVSLLS